MLHLSAILLRPNGLRDYGTEPQVWGGDPVCEHEWGDEGKSEQRLRNGLGSNTVKAAFAETIHPSTEAFCRHCNAWRGSLGLEPTPALYIEHMVEVFRAVRRVLRKEGTCWLNIGDSYATGAGSAKSPGGGAQGDQWAGRGIHTAANSGKAGPRIAATGPISQPNRMPQPGLKPKDLMLIPSRLAIRLQDDGWWVRSDIAWCKRAPMPESCTDRPTSAWEHVFLLTRSAKYFYDAEAVKEEAERAGEIPGGNYVEKGLAAGVNGGWAGGQVPNKRNMRNFWLLGPAAFAEAHFATFVPEIPRRAILAGTSERGVCPKCGAPWARVVKSKTETHRRPGEFQTGRIGGDSVETKDRAGDVETETIGWRATCSCEQQEADGKVGPHRPVPATVLDLFLGAGTTALVADRLGRDCVGIDLSPKYAEMARRRLIRDVGPLVRSRIEVE